MPSYRTSLGQSAVDRLGYCLERQVAYWGPVDIKNWLVMAVCRLSHTVSVRLDLVDSDLLVP